MRLWDYLFRILLRNGAQVDARAREQQTALHIASRLGNVDIVMLLLQVRFDSLLKNRLAVYHKNSVFLQHGAQVDATTKDLYTALHIAAKEGQDEVRNLIAKKIMDHIDTVNSIELFWIRHREYLI